MRPHSRITQARAALGLASLLAAVPGCGRSVDTADGSATTDAPTSGTDAPSSGADAALQVMCGSATPVFPAFDRACTQATECFVAIHQTDCCGNESATGLNTTQAALFQFSEATCRSQYPGCGCPSGPIRLDDGQMVPVSDRARIVADCLNGQCSTTVR